MATDEVDSFLRGVASAPALRPPPRVGERLGDRYIIEAFLGEGGMGSVYRALDETLGEVVALKLVKGNHDEATLREEVRLSQKVTHPNVCRTFDLEHVDGRQVVKMEYVAGETLANRLERDRKLPIAEAVRIARSIAAGLGAAHARRIVHSDLKPGNVMLDGDRVVLMDFGIAHLAASPTEGVYGTIGYIAPERLRDKTGDARSDLYALGCVIYEMLSGERLFAAGTTVAIAIEQFSRPVRKLRDVPRWLARATHALLSNDPHDRSRGLRELTVGPRSRRRLALAVAATTAVAVTTATWVWPHQRSWSPVDWKADPALDENMGDAAVSPDGRWVIVATSRFQPPDGYFDLAIGSLASNQLQQLETPKGLHVSSVAWSNDGNALVYLASVSMAGRERARAFRQMIAGSPPHLVGPAHDVTPGGFDDLQEVFECGDTYGYVRWTPGARVEMWIGGTAPLYVAPLGASIAARCDRAGTRVAVVVGSLFTASDLIVIDPATGDRDHLTQDHSVAGAPTFTNDGRSIVVAHRVDRRLQQSEIRTSGGDWKQITFGDGPNVNPAISSDGRTLAYIEDQSVFVTQILGLPRGEGFISKELAGIMQPRVVDRDLVVAQRDRAGVPSEVTSVRLSNRSVTHLAYGSLPFPSFDQTSVRFVSPTDRWLGSVPLDGGNSTVIAILPGRIVDGCAGPDGDHVLVEIDDTQHGYLVDHLHQIHDEGTDGLVCTSSSGWKAITRAAAVSTAGKGARSPSLEIVAPDGTSEMFGISSLHNRWLDDYRVTYCRKACVIHDVRTGAVTTLDPETPIGGTFAIVTDDNRILDWGQRASATLHAITNFGDR